MRGKGTGGREGTTYVQHAKLPAMVYADRKRYWQPGRTVEKLELVDNVFKDKRKKEKRGFLIRRNDKSYFGGGKVGASLPLHTPMHWLKASGKSAGKLATVR